MILIWWILTITLVATLLDANHTFPVVNVGSGTRLNMDSTQCSNSLWKINSHPVGLPCLKIVTSNQDNSGGDLLLWVETNSGTMEEVDSTFENGAVVLEGCYWEDIVSVKMQGKSNGWLGSVSYSHNGGDTYVPMTCLSCSGPSNSAANIVVDGDGNFTSGVDTRCVNGAICTLIKRPSNCVKVVTGGQTKDNGKLVVQVDTGTGPTQEASGNYARNSVVVDKCYETENITVKAKNTHTNGWAGAITYSSNGGQTYAVMECLDCTGPQKTTERISVDGNDDGQNAAKTWCVNGATCTLIKRPSNCVKVVTGGQTNNNGPLIVQVDTGTGPTQEASGSHYAKNSVVVDKCYETEIVSVKARAKSSDGWAGAITYSSNGGQTYAAMECSNCAGPQRTTEKIAFDGDANSAEMADTRCFNGATCSLVKRHPNCVKVITGGDQHFGGSLEVQVDTGSGPAQEASGSYGLNQAVVDKCSESEIVSLKVRNPTTDGWVGAITHSYDGGHTYAAMECLSGCTGSATTTGKIGADYNADDAWAADTNCLNGETCTIMKLGTTTTTTTSVYTLQAINDGGAANLFYLGHYGVALGMFANATTATKWLVQRAGEINNSRICTLQAVSQQNSSEGYLSSNGSALQMASTPDTANEKWLIAGFC